MNVFEKNFIDQYPPTYIVSFDGEYKVKHFNYAHKIKDEEIEWILIQAYRGLKKRYGISIVFSQPELSTSFVYRSEREYLESYSERFAWRVHAYECAFEGGDVIPVRYAGVLFVRPQSVYYSECSVDFEEEDALQHDEEMAPAICEGYLRPPKSLAQSPFYSCCLKNYARPYNILPFDSIPFMASIFGASCGHSALATAILMSVENPVFSPYELAVGTAQIRNNATTGYFVDSDGLTLNEMKKLMDHYCPSRGYVGNLEIGEPDSVKKFADNISSYLYQGIPVLLPVDHDVLYDYKKSDLDTPTCMPVNEDHDKQKRHMILIHGIVKPGPRDNNIPSFVYSDSTDLHDTGDIFHRATSQRLLSSTISTEPNVDKRGKFSYGVCFPKGLQVTEGEALHFAKKVDKDIDKLTLRSISQLRGYLFHKVFPEIYRSPHRHRIQLQKWREIIREYDVPEFVWVGETPDGSKGVFIDSKKDMGDRAAFQGKYQIFETAEPTITVQGMTKKEAFDKRNIEPTET